MRPLTWDIFRTWASLALFPEQSRPYVWCVLRITVRHHPHSNCANKLKVRGCTWLGGPLGFSTEQRSDGVLLGIDLRILRDRT